MEKRIVQLIERDDEPATFKLGQEAVELLKYLDDNGYLRDHTYLNFLDESDILEFEGDVVEC